MIGAYMTKLKTRGGLMKIKNELKKCAGRAEAPGMAKRAFDWGAVKNKISAMANQVHGAARDAWHSVPTEYKPLVGALAGAGGGALGGAALGGITGLGAGRGALVGAGLGGIGGGLFGAKSMAKYLNAAKKKELADAANAHSAALAGKDRKFRAALAGKDRKLADAASAIKGKDKELASLKDKLGIIATNFTPQELANMTIEERRPLLKNIEQLKKVLEDKQSVIAKSQLRNRLALSPSLRNRPDVVEQILKSKSSAGIAKAIAEAGDLSMLALENDAKTQAQINQLLEQIRKLQSQPASNLLPKVYNK
jgi:hypothetical protein